jgi:sugar phosphate permease
MLTGWAFRTVFLLVPLLIAIRAPESGSRMWVAMLIGSVFFFCLFRSLGVAAWLPWLYTILPSDIRGRYFATDQMIAGLGGVGTLLLCALLFKLVPLYEAFRLEYLIALIGSLLSLMALARLPNPPPTETVDLSAVARETPRILVRRSRFRQYLLIGIWFAVAVTPIPPFCAYYLKVGPGLSASQILVLTTLQYAGVIVGATLIRSRIDRLGPKPFFRIAMIVYAAVAMYWIAHLSGILGGIGSLYGVYFLLGLAASLWFSAALNYLPQVMKTGKRALMVSINSACAALAGGLSPIVWGFFLKNSGSVASIDADAFRLYFVFVLVSAIGLFLFLNRLPAAVTLRRERLPGVLVFRPFRAMTNLAGLGVTVLRRKKNGEGGERQGTEESKAE